LIDWRVLIAQMKDTDVVMTIAVGLAATESTGSVMMGAGHLRISPLRLDKIKICLQVD
jgi:hypothetical protein